MNQIILNGVSLEGLLQRFEQIIDAKIGGFPTTQEQQTDYITRQECAQRLRITLATLHSWTKLGYLTSYKIGTRVLYKASEVKMTLEKVPQFKYKKGVHHA